MKHLFATFCIFRHPCLPISFTFITFAKDHKNNQTDNTMKKSLLLLFAALLPILISCERVIVVEKECECECEQEQEKIITYTFGIDVKNKSIGQEKGSFKINVSSNHEWEAIVRKPSTDYIIDLEIDRNSGNGDAVITVSYSKPGRKFYYSPGNKETGYIDFNYKKGTNKEPQSARTTCIIQRVQY